MTILENVTKAVLYTGSYGRKGCTCKCPGCYLGEYGERKSMYQGKVEQVHELLAVLPNLEKVLIFGNPDISVDSGFCNEVARILQDRGILMAFFTSGIGGAAAIETLMKDIKSSSVKSITFSVDSLDEKKRSIIRGVDIPMQTIVDGIEYCKRLNVPFAMSFTIWPITIDEDWFAYEQFFSSLGTKKMTAHFGSIEGTRGRVSHVSEEKILEIRGRYQTSSLIFPYCVTTDEEYEEYVSAYVKGGKLKCQNPNAMYAYLEEDGIKTSIFCPVYTTVHPEYFVTLNELKELKIPVLEDISKCPVSKQALGFECSKYNSVCRFYKGLH